MLENLFPPIFVPGARLGISNIFILSAAIFLGYGYAFAAFLVKVILGSVFAGNPSAILYSLPSGAIALAVELLLLRFSVRVSVTAISTVGSVINIILQNTVFCVITRTYAYFAYSPYLALIGTLSGAAVGFCVYLAVKLLPEKLYAEQNR